MTNTYEKGLPEIMRMLKEGVERISEEKELRSYLDTVARFHDYSPANCLLISMQRPDATLVAGYGTWKKAFGRNVRKGEKGIRIVAPFLREKEIFDEREGTLRTVKVPSFRAVSVFDVSQTYGRELPELRIDLLKGKVRNFESMMDILSEVSPVPIYIEEMSGNRNGYCDLSKGRIGINSSLSEAHIVKTTVHEIAHAVLRDMKRSGPKSVAEVEAESVAYCVCRHLGLDTSDYSFKYVAAWKGMVKERGMESLSAVREASSRLIESIDEKIRQREDRDLFSEREGDAHVR